MMIFSIRKSGRRRADVALIVAFFAILWLPALDRFLHLDRAPRPKENRELAVFPKFQRSLAGAGKFFAGLEAYFSDNFGFRNQLMGWEHRLRWGVFHDPPPNANVLLGHDGWLFFSNGETVEDITGAKPFRETDLESWRTLLTGRRDWLRERGIRYLFVIPPDKQSIYPEHLPHWLTKGGRTPQRLTQFVKYMRQHSDVPILDLRETLLEAKNSGDIYRHTDTHWNDRGAFAGYRRIVQELTALGIPGAPLEAGSFQETVADLRGGDLARLLGRESLMADRSSPVLSPNPARPFLQPRVDESILRKKWLPDMSPCITENPAATGRLLFFRDSFCERLLQFFALGYGRSVFIWQQYWDKPLIERERPDIVIDEMLERFVIFGSPEELRGLDQSSVTPVSAAK